MLPIRVFKFRDMRIRLTKAKDGPARINRSAPKQHSGPGLIMRQIGKQILTLTKPYTLILALFLVGAFSSSGWAQHKSVVTDILTGVALSGYDPVAYYTVGTAVQGTPIYAHEWDDAVWYFSSAANRDVFARDPEIYAPLFGGHCAMSMARGYLSDGNPHIFRIIDDKLVLFYSIGNREAFDMSSISALARAMVNWNKLPNPVALPNAL